MGLLALSGCVASSDRPFVLNPAQFPDHVGRPRPDGDDLLITGRSPGSTTPPPASIPGHDLDSPTSRSLRQGHARLASGLQRYGVPLLAREAWARQGANPRRVNLMGGVTRITVHHEGWTPVYFHDQATTAKRLELVRHAHVSQRGWGDIGYHYIIDRAGRVWEARDVRYQGAHVRDHNPHNLGVMLLGNFEEQQPSDPQFRSLYATLRELMAAYDVPVDQVKTHREWVPTACPGKNLQPRVAGLRSTGRLA